MNIALLFFAFGVTMIVVALVDASRRAAHNGRIEQQRRYEAQQQRLRDQMEANLAIAREQRRRTRESVASGMPRGPFTDEDFAAILRGTKGSS